jgi:prophage regulatory protein
MLATVDTLVGSQELTRLLGVKRARVYQLTNAPDFPPPIAVLAMGSIWRLADVTAWAEQRGRTLDLAALGSVPVQAEDDNS